MSQRLCWDQPLLLWMIDTSALSFSFSLSLPLSLSFSLSTWIALRLTDGAELKAAPQKNRHCLHFMFRTLVGNFLKRNSSCLCFTHYRLLLIFS